jgi:hypothetical protein
MTRNFPALLIALSCLAPIQLTGGVGDCPDLTGKDAAAHLEYLRGDRSKLTAQCVVGAIRYLGGKRYAEASTVLIQYLDYANPVYLHQPGLRGSIPYVYPAVDSLVSHGKPVVPELISAIGDASTTEVARRNAAEAIAFIYGASRPDAITALVSAAQAQAPTDPMASGRLMDQARWLADRCTLTMRNDCENALVK